MAKLTEAEMQSPQYLEHRLEWRRMWWEKGLLAFVIAAALFFGNLIIENFKTDLTVSKFLLEERLKGLKAIRAAYSEVTECMQCCFPSTSNCKYKQYDELFEKYQSKLINFGNVVNEWSMLYPDDFSKTLTGHFYIHSAIAYKKIVLTKDHFYFLSSVCRNFDYVTRIALYKSTLGQNEKRDTGIFEFHKDSMDKLIKLSPKKFFDINLEKHNKENPKK